MQVVIHRPTVSGARLWIQAELKERWAEDKRWEPQLDEDERERQYARWKKAVQRSLGWVD